MQLASWSALWGYPNEPPSEPQQKAKENTKIPKLSLKKTMSYISFNIFFKKSSILEVKMVKEENNAKQFKLCLDFLGVTNLFLYTKKLGCQQPKATQRDGQTKT